MKLNIYTLGDFDITYGGNSILKESGRSYKLFKLFKYLVTFRGRKLLPETIIESLWEDYEYSDPKSVLRTQIFRLRQILNKINVKETEKSRYFNITFINGYYCFELGDMVFLDAEDFEKYIRQGDSKKYNSINETIELYRKAISLYKGPYLQENSYETWLVPIRNHYSRSYLKTLFKLVEILKEKEEYADIIEMCEEAIIIEPYEEALHIYLIEAMLKTGQIKNAMSHYEYITSLLNSELGVKNSPGLRNIYRKIKTYYDEKSEAVIESIRMKLTEDFNSGALLCDSDYFRFLFNIGQRNSLRDGKMNYISLITISSKNTIKHNKDEMKKRTKALSNILEKSLRKGDVYSFWNDTQILIMLNGAKEDSLGKIETRIRKGFCSIAETDNYSLDINFLPLTSKQNMA
ncbi:MAG TPA: BTAD domain-containing putative transcriptional regulator [Bacillota bacterium]|mgnify:FL=1|nr:BTAD domain-containing putative transcriptional regulator [Bacillota bacterium]